MGARTKNLDVSRFLGGDNHWGQGQKVGTNRLRGGVAVIKAVKDGGSPVYAWEAERGSEYFCPECGREVVLKRGEVRAAHFAHASNSGCPNVSSESWQHLQMKENMIKLLRKYYGDEKIDSEVVIVDGRRADVILKVGVPLVIECQVSPISISELKARTKDYLDAGCRVSWVFHLNRVKRDDFYERVGAVRIPEEIRYLDSKKQPLFFMDDRGRIRKCELKYKWARGSELYTKTMCFCNFFKVHMLEFVAGVRL